MNARAESPLPSRSATPSADGSPSAETATTTDRAPDASARSVQRMAAILAASVIALLLATAGTLWAVNGTAVFFEMILAGLNACF